MQRWAERLVDRSRREEGNLNMTIRQYLEICVYIITTLFNYTKYMRKSLGRAVGVATVCGLNEQDVGV
jgi:hypothetical protein